MKGIRWVGLLAAALLAAAPLRGRAASGQRDPEPPDAPDGALVDPFGGAVVPAQARRAPPKRRDAAASPGSPGPAEPRRPSVGGFVGYETSDVSGLSIRADGELPYRDLTPRLSLSWIGSLGYSRLTESAGVPGFPAKLTADVVKLVPSARLTFPATPRISVFGDAGLGLYRASWSISYDDAFANSVLGFSESAISVLLRIGAGAFYSVNERVRVGALLELDHLFGKFDRTTKLVQLGAMFAL